MICPECGGKMLTVNSRRRPGLVYRRRQCEACGIRLSSHERLVVARSGRPLQVLGDREAVETAITSVTEARDQLAKLTDTLSANLDVYVV